MIKKFLSLVVLFYFSTIFCNLFQECPTLQNKIPYISLGNWPTNVKKLEVLSEQINAHIYLKDEGDCGTRDQEGLAFFGGNKVRKLEFLLADAIAKGYSTVLTYGGLASNHVVATACYAHTLGLQTIGLLFDQYPPTNISRNLLLNLYFGAHIFMCPQSRVLNEDEIASFLNEHGFLSAYVIPVGGSNVLGVLGVVNGVFELRDQIAQGLLPEPDIMYVPFGSMGTTAGLLLGIKLAGLKTKVCAIKVTKTEKYNEGNVILLAQESNRFLNECDSSIPVFAWSSGDVTIYTEYRGDGYAHPLQSGQEALKLFKELENITLDQTYTAKAAAALIDDCRNKKMPKDAVILFWNTYCSYEYPDLANKINPTAIPEWMMPYL